MDPRPSQKGIIAAIVFASAVLSGSLIFSSLALTGQLGASVISKPATTEANAADIDQKIQAGIDEYAKRKAAESPTAAPTAAPARTNTAAQNVRKADAKKDHLLGKADARISLIEYSDFECPYCRMFHATAKQLIEKNGDKVNWVYRHYPLPSHEPAATLLATASECIADQAGNDGFWKFSGEIFSPTAQRTGNDDKAWALDIAAKLGYDKAKLDSCLTANTFVSKVQESYTEGSSFGVNGTPGNFLVDNKTGKVQFVPGALSYDRLKSLVDGMMAE